MADDNDSILRDDTKLRGSIIKNYSSRNFASNKSNFQTIFWIKLWQIACIKCLDIETSMYNYAYVFYCIYKFILLFMQYCSLLIRFIFLKKNGLWFRWHISIVWGYSYEVNTSRIRILSNLYVSIQKYKINYLRFSDHCTNTVIETSSDVEKLEIQVRISIFQGLKPKQ